MFPIFEDELGKMRVQEFHEAADRYRLIAGSRTARRWKAAMARRLIGAGARLIGACADDLWKSVRPIEVDAAL